MHSYIAAMTQLSEALLLDSLPDEGQEGSTTARVQEALFARGIEARWLRSIRRSLQRLEDQGLATSELRGRDLYWWKLPGVGGIAASAQKRMNLDEALALRMLEIASQAYQLPWIIRSEIGALFTAARVRLERAPTGEAHRNWEDRVAVLDEGMTRLPAPMSSVVSETISIALFKTLRVSMRYLTVRDEEQRRKKPHDMLIEPLGWVSRNGLHYVVARRPDTGDMRTYRLDRIQSAKLEDAFFYPKDFSLKRYIIEEGAFDYPGNEERITVVLQFVRKSGLHLLRTPINQTQEILSESGSAITLKFESLNSEKLLWWIRGFGPYVEVLEPSELRATLKNEAMRSSQLYQRG